MNYLLRFKVSLKNIHPHYFFNNLNYFLIEIVQLFFKKLTLIEYQIFSIIAN